MKIRVEKSKIEGRGIFANEDIRNGKITRQEAIEIVKKYDGTCSEKYIKSFCEYIDISVNTFWEVVDQNVNKGLFHKDFHGNWMPKFQIGEDYNEN